MVPVDQFYVHIIASISLNLSEQLCEHTSCAQVPELP